MPRKHLEPGDIVTVGVVANAGGAVATENDLVTIAGEGPNHTNVELSDEAGTAIGMIDAEPDDFDAAATYAAGTFVDTTDLLLYKPVLWVEPSATYTPAPGDEVVADAGGTVRAYAPGATPADTPDMIFGKVWGTHQRGTEYTSNLIAVVVY